MTLEAFLETWLETYIEPKRAANTVRAYRFALAHLSDQVRRTELAHVDALTLQREINRLAASYSRQAQLLFVALRCALRRAYRLQLIERNPMDTVDPPTHTAREISVLDPAEAAAYMRQAAGTRCGPLLILMLCLGLRRNEARGLRFGDLDDQGILRIRWQRIGDALAPLKSRASRRDIPVPEPLRALFQGPDGEYLVDVSENTLRRAHLAVLRAIGIDRRITLHGLRHTCATLGIASGAELITVQKLLGHAHFQLTADLYCHPATSVLTAATARIYNSCAGFLGARLEIV